MVTILLTLGISLLSMQHAGAANRIFNLHVKNGTAELQNLFLTGGNCYEGDGVNNPNKTLYFPTLFPGDSYTVTLARVQGNFCDGEQGHFTLQPVAFPDVNDASPLSFDNAGNLGLGNTLPNRYHAVLSAKSPVDESYTWTLLPIDQRLTQPVDQRLTRPRNHITTHTGEWAHKNGSTLRQERFLFVNNGFFGNHYESCFGNPFFHPQHVQRLADKDGRAYFMITQSLSHNGNMYLVETFDGVLNEATGRLDPVAGGGAVGQIIWEEVFTGDFNGTLNPIGNWNHPGKMALVDGVLIMAAQNWSEGQAADGCSNSTSNPYQRGDSEDAALFFDVRDPSAPRYWGKMTASELQVPQSNAQNGGANFIIDRMISVVSLWRTAEGKYALNAGGRRNESNHYATWETDTISPNIDNWVKRDTFEYTSGEYGDDFESYQALSGGVGSAETLTDGMLRNVAFEMTNAGAGGGLNDGFLFRTIESEVDNAFTAQWNLGLNDDDTWIAASHHATRQGAPLVYTVQNTPGPHPELWQVYDTRNNLQVPFPDRVVSNLNDSGPGSLRDAIGYGGAISFSSTLNGGTLYLTSGPLIVNLYDVEINASDLPNGLIISAQHLSRVLHVTSGNHAALIGLTIRHGFARAEPLAPGIASSHNSLGGGGILNEGSLLLSQSTVMENISEKDGGGIFNAGTLEMRNSTVAENYSAAKYINPGAVTNGQAGGGGGISNVGEALLIHTTVARNTDFGRGFGGIMTRGGGLVIDNSIIAANTPSNKGNLSGAYSALGANIVNSLAGGSLTDGQLPIEVPSLSLKALGYYGGNTPTMPPSDEDSPAVDSAETTVHTIKIGSMDQNGLLRPSGNGFDIGAVELAGAMVFVSPSAARVYTGIDFYYQIAVSGNIATAFAATGLPSGLVLDATTGIISGRVNASGTYHVQLSAINASETVDSSLVLAINPPGFTVSTLSDSGPGSLRNAINAAPAGSTITFAPALSGKTIVLINGPLDISQYLFIDASALVNGITIDGNGGPGVFNTGPLEVSIDSLTITGGDSNGVGGGIRNNGVLNLRNSTLHNNAAAFAGGGISSSGTLRVENSTLFNNRSLGYGDSSSGYGGAIHGAGKIDVIHSTLVGNQAQAGGGMALSAVVLKLENSIVAGNIALSSADIVDISSAENHPVVARLGRNLIGDNSSVETLFPEAALTGTMDFPLDPMLQAAGNYGGPTLTMPPSSGSPAIDAAILLATTPATDQQGKIRPAGPFPDIGAVEIKSADVEAVEKALKSTKKLEKNKSIRNHKKSRKYMKKARKHLQAALGFLETNDSSSASEQIDQAKADFKKVSKKKSQVKKIIKQLNVLS